MSYDENMVVETAERIFRDLANLQTIVNSHDDNWKQPLWIALANSGLPLAWVSEEPGGSDRCLEDGFGVLRAVGRQAIGVPLAETMLAGWLLSRAGIASPDTAMSVVPAGPGHTVVADEKGRLSGHVRKVPFASEVSHLAVLAVDGDAYWIALVDAKECEISRRSNLAGDPADEVLFVRTKPAAIAPAPRGLNETALMMMGAASRCQQIAGALETMLALSANYSMVRVAFDKPISRFQAVQHNLARLGGETAAAVSAACSAADAIATGAENDELFLEVAAAKIRCGEAAEKGAAVAHQVHGAIGFTAEHILHRLTLRALAWRNDFGSESYWALELGKVISMRGPDALWPLIASR